MLRQSGERLQNMLNLHFHLSILNQALNHASLGDATEQNKEDSNSSHTRLCKLGNANNILYAVLRVHLSVM